MITRRKIMKLIHKDSLALTLDAVNDAFLLGQSISKPDSSSIAEWIVSRHGLPQAYANMFAPTEKDFQTGIVLFTGEKVSSHVGTSHILGQEASRILKLLDAQSAEAKKAIQEADDGFSGYMRAYVKPDAGTYCCVTCSCAFWRRISAAPLDGSERILEAAVKTLKSLRNGKGRWNKFPFYYTLLALNDIELPSAYQELRYAAPACERILKKATKTDKISNRRRILAERILEKC
jgi:hypothetical protein